MRRREEAEEAEEEEEENRKSKDHLNFCLFSANVHNINCFPGDLFNDHTAQKASIEFATFLSQTIKSQLRMLFRLWSYSFVFKEELSGKPTDVSFSSILLILFVFVVHTHSLTHI